MGATAGLSSSVRELHGLHWWTSQQWHPAGLPIALTKREHGKGNYSTILSSFRLGCFRSTATAVAIVVVMAVVHDIPAQAQRFASAPYGTPAGSSPTADMLRGVEIEQHLGAQLPLDAEFHDEMGRRVKLGDYFGKQPVVVALVYYRCPMLCTQVLNGLLHSSQAVPLEIGRDYQVITVSFDPRETPELAAEKKTRYVRAYRRGGAVAGWHFLTGDRPSIDRLTETVGFRYRFDPKSDQFAHASGIAVATPDGRLARYFYGIDYSPDDLRLGLIESSAGRIGSLVDQVLLLCFHYDPMTGKYGLVIADVLRMSGLLTVVILSCFLLAMYRRERRRPKLLRGDLLPHAVGQGPDQVPARS
jgi:protein SCO1/2